MQTPRGPALTKVSREVAWDARPFGGSVSRIYRDTRFSKDKRPYKTHVGIHFGHRQAGDGGEHLPGFYLHLEPGESCVYSGMWRPEGLALARIRQAIDADPKGWGTVRRRSPPAGGDSYARVPSGFAPDHPFAEDLRRKDFFAGRGFPDRLVTSAEFDRRFLAACRGLNPLNAFLARAIGTPW